VTYNLGRDNNNNTKAPKSGESDMRENGERACDQPRVILGKERRSYSPAVRGGKGVKEEENVSTGSGNTGQIR